MAKYVAFLRGVNVGGRNIKMADVKGCFENMGFADVSTVLQTGNVLFEAAGTDTGKLKKKLGAGLNDRFAYPARAHVYALERLTRIVEACPFPDNDPEYHSYIVFMEGGLGREFVSEGIILEQGERIQLGDTVVYWRCRKGRTLQSQVGKYLSSARYRDYNTNRNLKTLKKIVGSRRGEERMGKDSLSKRVAKEEQGPAPVQKKTDRESSVKKAVSKIRRAVTEERRRKGFI